MAEKSETNLFLELGQVIQINAPGNKNINQHIYLIDYLDDNIIELIDNNDLSQVQLTLKYNKFTDESIESIYILSIPTV